MHCDGFWGTKLYVFVKYMDLTHEEACPCEQI